MIVYDNEEDAVAAQIFTAPRSRGIKPAWCDRLGIMAVLFIAGVTAVITADGNYSRIDFQTTVNAGLYVGGAVWLALRALDFIAGGPWIRGRR